MKKRKSILIVLMTVLMVMLLSTTAFAAKPKLSKRRATLKAGKTLTLTLKNAKKSKVKWSSSNKKIATVKKGKVTPKKNGTVRIRAKYKGKTYTCTVKVKGFSKTAIKTVTDKQAEKVKEKYEDTFSEAGDLINMSQRGDNEYFGICIQPYFKDSNGMTYRLINGEKYYYAPIMKINDIYPEYANSLAIGLVYIKNGKDQFGVSGEKITFTYNFETYKDDFRLPSAVIYDEETCRNRIDRDIIVYQNERYVVCGCRMPVNTKFKIIATYNGMTATMNCIAVNRDINQNII